MYFAYGSNLWSEQMRKRCPSSKPLTTAELLGYRLHFIQPHDGWGGGVAGVVRDQRSVVPGVVYELSGEDVQRLDGFEPVGSGRYWRDDTEVRQADGSALRCWIYRGSVFPDAPYEPSASYIKAMVDGATEIHYGQKVSEDYFQVLGVEAALGASRTDPAGSLRSDDSNTNSSEGDRHSQDWTARPAHGSALTPVPSQGLPAHGRAARCRPNRESRWSE